MPIHKRHGKRRKMIHISGEEEREGRGVVTGTNNPFFASTQGGSILSNHIPHTSFKNGFQSWNHDQMNTMENLRELFTKKRKGKKGIEIKF